jgi:hypothetical protein
MRWWVRGVCLVAELKRLVFFDQLRRKRAPPRKFPVTARPNAGLVRAVTMKALSVSPQNPHGNARLDGGMAPSLPGFIYVHILSTRQGGPLSCCLGHVGTVYCYFLQILILCRLETFRAQIPTYAFISSLVLPCRRL